ncbi:coiled-coil domain-containing protein [Brumimicrobium oceani]|uniref:DUF4175 domain-containing protein n=1 Tax=Brumimicrobium oceani TaxID=2100725 RepID=A0A2U2XAV5_9FLAO|nr:hypothetical protein [Brumimicrobium oceani]PWH84924.1 hypothetical protein DIT68_12335 [Brumimicrobium oceani]
MGTFDDLISQVDAFIRKYYKNLMIKGLFLFLIIFLATFLLVSGLEFIGRFNSFIRALLFFSFVTLNGYVLIKYFIVPLSKLFSFGKRISRYQAAHIIGNFFPTVNDKLLNTLQLNETTETNPKNIEFLKASIQQNAKQLNTLSFTSAIDYSANKKFLRYFLPILTTVVLIGIMAPNFFSDSTQRLIKYNQVFEIAPDFTFELKNENLMIEEGSNFKVEVHLIPLPGKALPDRVYLESDDGTFLMEKTANNKASYTLNNLNSDLPFRFKAANAVSKTFTIDVVKRTSLGQLKVDIDYPSYLKRASESIENPGDLIVPEGTQLTWNGITKNTKSLKIISTDTTMIWKEQTGFRFQQELMSRSTVSFILENKELAAFDSTFYSIDVVKDEYPVINLTSTNDSVQKNKIYFSGTVKDDHGLTRLMFNYTILKKEGQEIKASIPVPGISGNQSPFSMTFNIDELPIELEDKVSYYFIVYDNDGVRGPKSTKSSVFQHSAPSRNELNELRKEDKDKAKEDLKELLRETQEFKEQMSRLKKEMANSKKSSWQQQKQVENLQKQQESLKSRLEQLKDKMKSSFEEKSKLSPMDERLVEKQKELEDLLESLIDEELKKLLDELEEMMKQNDTKDLMEKMEEGEMSAEEMDRQLDRTMEMLKKMDVEERVEDLQKSLEELAGEQEELKKDIESGMNKEDASKNQEELNKKFETLKDDLEEMLEKNEELSRPFSLDDLEESAKDVKEEMAGAKEDLEKEKNSSAGDKQKKASEKMEEMASQMAAQMQDSQQQQLEEDLESLRALLENLMRMSFDQEENMEAFKNADSYDPIFVELGKDQRRIIDNLKPVKDSLRALADRIPKIASFIEQELGETEKQYKYIPSHIGEREKRQLGVKQQFAMTSINNLALFLNETLESAQQSMAQMQGNKSCDKPGQGKPGKGKPGQGKPGDMESMKEMLKKQLEDMKKGSNPDGNKPGSKPGGMLPMNSQQAAKMAAQQNAMQKKLRELREQLNKDGSGDGNQLNDLLKELEEQEEKLINKDWTSELIERQEQILTRLLESEKAMQERGLDDQRESKSGKDQENGNQIEFLEYKKQKEKQIELLRTLDPSFSKYYKEKANVYFLNVN